MPLLVVVPPMPMPSNLVATQTIPWLTVWVPHGKEGLPSDDSFGKVGPPNGVGMATEKLGATRTSSNSYINISFQIILLLFKAFQKFSKSRQFQKNA